MLDKILNLFNKHQEENRRLKKELKKLKAYYEQANELAKSIDVEDIDLNDIPNIHIKTIIAYFNVYKYNIVAQTTRVIDKPEHIIFRNWALKMVDATIKKFTDSITVDKDNISNITRQKK